MFTTRPELSGDHGMVASTHWLASAAGMSVLERGGNAFDAAVTAGFVLQVAEPHLNGPGGEVPALVWPESEQRVSVVCGQGVAPAAATIDTVRGLGVDLMPGTGLLPATVPGAFGGWLLMLQRWGTWRLRDVLAPAIHYAEHGIPVLERIASTIGTVADMFRTDWPTSAATWLPDGAVPVAGGRFVNPVLAATYRRVVAEAEAHGAGGSRESELEAARSAWYQGFVAEAVAEFCAGRGWRDTSGDEHAGLLTGDDLASWRATVERPISLDYHGHTVFKTDSWGQGPVFLQQLALLSGFDLDAASPAEFVHTVTESAKLAFADREAWYGDPRHADVPLTALLSAEYNEGRRGLIGPAASGELRPGSPAGRTPRLPVYPEPIVATAASGVVGGVGEPTVPGAAAPAGPGDERTAANGRVNGDTCHLDVVDRWGNMVSATPSGGWLQSSPTIPALGFCLGTRGQMFWLQEGLPASLRPGARPRTTLSPSFATRAGRPWLAFGTPGGDQQDQWSVNFFLSLVHGGLNLQEAIDAPNFHSVHFPSSFYPRGSRPNVLFVEDRMDPAAVAELRRRGHDVEVQPPWSLGRLSAAARDAGWPGTGFLRAAANPRGAQGYAVGR